MTWTVWFKVAREVPRHPAAFAAVIFARMIGALAIFYGFVVGIGLIVGMVR
jgi:hypothetical protein